MRTAAIDLPKLEREIVIEPRHVQPVDFAQKHHREQLPAYIKATDGVDPIGQLSAAAVARMYEEAAQAVEAMGEEQQRVVERCEQVIAESHGAMEDAKAAAQALRQRGKEQFAMVENWALLTASVRKTCVEMKEKTLAEITTVA